MYSCTFAPLTSTATMNAEFWSIIFVFANGKTPLWERKSASSISSAALVLTTNICSSMPCLSAPSWLWFCRQMWMGDHGDKLEPHLVPDDMPLYDLWVECLHENPESRPSIGEVVDSLRRREMRRANMPDPAGMQVAAKTPARRHTFGFHMKRSLLKPLTFVINSVRRWTELKRHVVRS